MLNLVYFLFLFSQFQCFYLDQSNKKKITLNLISSTDQLALEGDSFTTECHINKVLKDIKLIWLKDGVVIDQYSDKNVFINLMNKINEQNDVLVSSLFIIRLLPKHSGNWSCHTISSKLNLTQSFTLKVITNDAKYCPKVTTFTNKGTYKWPITLSETTRTLPCKLSSPLIYSHLKASYYCNKLGIWDYLNLTDCPYLSQVTKILEKFASINITKNHNSAFSFEILKSLANYIGNGSIIKDKMDIVFIANTISNIFLLPSKSNQVIIYLIEIINSMMNVPSELVIKANQENQSSSIFLSSLIKLSSLNSNLTINRLASNMAVKEIMTSFDSFLSTTCLSFFQTFDYLETFWKLWHPTFSKKSYTNKKTFYCNFGLNSEIIPTKFKSQAYIHLPSKFFEKNDLLLNQKNLRIFKLQFVIFRNSNLFEHKSFSINQTNSDSKFFISSLILGCFVPKFPKFKIFQPIEIGLKVNFYSQNLIPVWWNPSTQTWSSKECKLSETNNKFKMIIFKCSKLGYYAVMANEKSFKLFQIQSSKSFQIIIQVLKILTNFTLVFTLIFLITITLIYSFGFSSILIHPITKHFLINILFLNFILIFVYFWNQLDSNEFSCLVISYVFEFVVVSSLLWMIINVVNIYSNQKQVNNEKQNGDGPSTSMMVHEYYFFIYSTSFIIFGIYLTICFNFNAKQCHSNLPFNLVVIHAPIILLAILTFLIHLIITCISKLTFDTVMSSHHNVSIKNDSSFLKTTHLKKEKEWPFFKKLFFQFVLCIIFFFEWISIFFDIWRPFFFNNLLIIPDDYFYQVLSTFFIILLNFYLFFFFFWNRQDVISWLKFWKKRSKNLKTSANFDVIRNEQNWIDDMIKNSETDKSGCSQLPCEEIRQIPDNITKSNKRIFKLINDQINDQHLIEIKSPDEILNGFRLNKAEQKFFDKICTEKKVEIKNVSKDLTDASLKKMINTVSSSPVSKFKSKSEILGWNKYYDSFQNRSIYPCCRPTVLCDNIPNVFENNQDNESMSCEKFKFIQSQPSKGLKKLCLKKCPSNPTELSNIDMLNTNTTYCQSNRLSKVSQSCSYSSKTSDKLICQNHKVNFRTKRSNNHNRYSYFPPTCLNISRSTTPATLESFTDVQKQNRKKPKKTLGSNGSNKFSKSNCNHSSNLPINSHSYCHFHLKNNTFSESD